MIYKKIIIIFLLILCIFSFSSFSSVHAENINVTSSSAERMKADIDYFKQLLKNNNINNMNDLVSFFGAGSSSRIEYFYIEDAGHIDTNIETQYAYFYHGIGDITRGVDNYNYYGIQQNSFSVSYGYGLRWSIYSGDNFRGFPNSSNARFTAPSCWLCVRTADLFTKDSSQIIENVLTQDKSSQDDINLNSHNNEMNNASDSIKNSNLYNKFSNLSNELQEAFTYNDNDVTTLPISFNNKDVVLKSNEISRFFVDNNLGFVVTLWQSILWFSLFYTMYLFIRKIYKSVAGGNPVDDVQKSLSQEDDKMIGGF